MLMVAFVEPPFALGGGTAQPSCFERRILAKTDRMIAVDVAERRQMSIRSRRKGGPI